MVIKKSTILIVGVALLGIFTWVGLALALDRAAEKDCSDVNGGKYTDIWNGGPACNIPWAEQ